MSSIILNSHSVPVGKLTDHFDKHLTSFFKSPSASAELVKSLLIQTDEAKRLKVPEKIRENIIQSLLGNLQSLSTAQFLAVPDLIRRLPQQMMSSDAEDKLIEAFFGDILVRLGDGAESEKVLLSLSRLHVRHPCREDMIVRFCQHISSASTVSSKLALLLLRGMVKVLPVSKLSHVDVRGACLKLLACAPGESAGSVLELTGKLCVMPEASSLVETLVSRWSQSRSPDEQVRGLIGMSTIALQGTVVEPLVRSVVSSVIKGGVMGEHLEAMSGPRLRLNRDVGKWIFTEMTEGGNFAGVSIKWSRKAVAGWMRLVSEVGTEGAVLEELVGMFSKSASSGDARKDTAAAVSALASLGRIGASEETLSQFFRLYVSTAELTSGMVTSIAATGSIGCTAILISSVEKMEDSRVVATLLVHSSDSEDVANRLRVLLKSEQSNIGLLTQIAGILSEGGLVHATPEVLKTARGKVLKETTAAVFRAVRMAPIPKIEKF